MKNTPQNQYFPANAERMDVHCLGVSESGCIGKYIPSALEISLGRGFCTPRPLGNLLGLGECIFRYIPPLGSVRIQYIPQLLREASSRNLKPMCKKILTLCGRTSWSLCLSICPRFFCLSILFMKLSYIYNG